MKILDRYVLLSFLKNYLISFMVLIGLYVVLHLVFNFDELFETQNRSSNTGFGAFVGVLYVIWDYYFYQIFLIYAQLSGVIAVAAAAFTLVRFSRFNELSPILSAGVPLLRTAMPIIIAALCLNVVLLGDQEVVIPHLIPKLTRKPDEIGPNAVQHTYRIDAMQDDKRALLFAAKYMPPTEHQEATMLEFDLIERDEHFVPTAHISAASAVYEEDSKSWRLAGGTRVTGLQPALRRSEARAITRYTSNVTPEEIALFRSGDYVELLSTSKIDELLKRPQSYGTVDLLRVKHARVTQWFMNVVLVLLGIACILTREPGRLKIDGIKLVLGTGVAMVTVFLCHQLAAHPPGDSSWSYRWPALMAWLPIFIFGPIAIVLLDRMHTKRS